MGNYFGFSKIKENFFSCFNPRVLENLKENFPFYYILSSLNRTNDDTTYQSESVSLLIEENDVPPGFF